MCRFGLIRVKRIILLPSAASGAGKTNLHVPGSRTAFSKRSNIEIRREVWYARLVTIMPDHVHLLLSFPDTEKRVQIVVSKWKEWTAKTLRIKWQRDFFEHRLRKEENLREKADYILANPVRAGLVDRTENWPYVFIAEPW